MENFAENNMEMEPVVETEVDCCCGGQEETSHSAKDLALPVLAAVGIYAIGKTVVKGGKALYGKGKTFMAAHKAQKEAKTKDTIIEVECKTEEPENKD